MPQATHRGAQQARHIPLEGAANLRDIGGFAAGDGEIRWGAVYRSDSLSNLTDADLDRVASLGLEVAIDFRSQVEIDQRGRDRLPAGVEHDHIEVLEVSGELGNSMMAALGGAHAEGLGELLRDGNNVVLMTETYRQLARNETGHRGFGRAVNLVAQAAGNASSLYHCHSGKDRTGWMTAILLSLLGVDRDVIFEDYLSSNDYLRESNAALFALIDSKGLDSSLFRPMLEQRAGYLQAAFDTAEQDYGDMASYTREALKVSDETVASLRARMIV